jgi:hypothetical protein
MSAPANISFGNLNGRNGFRLTGIETGDRSGFSVASAGDVNGDGYDDLIIGAVRADPNGVDRAGESYVVFGSGAGFPVAVSMADLDGQNGFVLTGIDAADGSGWSVASAGDVNGDGFDDVIIGAYYADPSGADREVESYVVFGSDAGFPAALSLSDLNGQNGFVLNGIDVENYTGWSVASAGDVNADGFDDVIIGATGASPNGVDTAGASYVVFGSNAGFPAALSLSGLNGQNGFVLTGIATRDGSGRSVASAGDVNGDGFDDVIVGASGTAAFAGESYVVFGSDAGFAAALSLSDLNGQNGFRLTGIDAFDISGHSVASAGDLNGDGFDDVIVGAYRADPNGNSQAGESYVVFGSDAGFPAALSLADLNGQNGFRLIGGNAHDCSGFSVASAGDMNGDGFDDLIIGAQRADPNGVANAGESYVVFGTDAGFPATLALANLNGQNGFRLEGTNLGGYSGYSVAPAGDVNGDGFDDVVVGALFADSNGVPDAGESYVIFGAATGFVLAAVDGTAGDDWLSLPDNWQSGLSRVVGGTGTDMMSFAGLDAGIHVNTHTNRAVSTQGSAPFDLEMDSIENVTGTSHDDVFRGSDRAETFRGLGGRDTFYGSDGGRDVYVGGSGVDTLSYLYSTDGVSLSLLRGRGFAGEARRDVVKDVENLTGTLHDDFLWGDHGNNRIEGLHGDDVIVGNGGNDYILAGIGTDVIVFSGNQGDYAITRDGIRTDVIDSVLGRDGHDVIGHAEILRFADGDLIL